MPLRVTKPSPLLLRLTVSCVVAVATGPALAQGRDSDADRNIDPTQRREAYVRALSGDAAATDGVRAARPVEAADGRAYRVAVVEDDWRFGLSAVGPRRLATDDRRRALELQALADDAPASSSRPPSFTISPTLSFRAAPGLTVMAAARIRHVNGHSGGQGAGALDMAGESPADAGLMETAALRGDGVSLQGYGLGGTFGALYAPGQSTRFALLFRSAVRFGEDDDRGGFGGGRNANAGKQVTPEAVSFSARQAFGPRWTATVNTQWTNWSRTSGANQPPGDGPPPGGSAFAGTAPPPGATAATWRDAWSMSASAAYQHDADWTFRASLAWDQSPASQAGDGVDGDRTWLSLSAGWRASDRLTLNAGYSHVFGGDSGGMAMSGGAMNGGMGGGGMTMGGGDIVALRARLTF